MLIETIIKRTLGLKGHRVDRVEEVGCGVLEVRIVSRRRAGPSGSNSGRVLDGLSENDN